MVASSEQRVPIVCGFCHANCGLIAEVSNGVMRRTRGNPEHPAGRGHICPKGAATPSFVHSPERLRQPLRRTEGGFEPVSWDEALDTVAARLLEIRHKYGAETLFLATGAPMVMAQADGFTQFMAAYGSSNVLGAGYLCHVPRNLAFRTVYGGYPAPDYQNTRCILMWGSNPQESRQWGSMSSYGRFTELIPEARKRGGPGLSWLTRGGRGWWTAPTNGCR